MKTNNFNETVTKLAAHREWDTTPLKFLFRRSKRPGNGSEQLLSIYRDHGVVPKDSRSDNFNKASDDLSKYQKVDSGDLVINKMKAWQGSVAISEHTGIISPAYFVYRPMLTTGMNTEYLHYLLRSSLYFQHYGSISTGVRPNQWDLDPTTFERTLLLRPATVEQEAIADYLDHETTEIDALMIDTAALAGTVALRRRSLIDHIFIDTAWPAIALKYRGELRSGLTLGKTYDGETQCFPYLRVANVQVGRVDLDEIATIDLPIAEAERYRLHEGDVLMTEGGDRDKLGRGAIWSTEIDPMLHQNHVFAFRCGSLLSPEFLVYALEATPARVYFDQTARQSTNLASTNSTVVKNFRLPMPPLEEQHRVVASLNHELAYMSEIVANAKKVADLARERRAALITAAVTGQIDVAARHKPAAEQLEDDIAQGLHREN